jgi:endonuclease YncB( thermonuclease family)
MWAACSLDSLVFQDQLKGEKIKFKSKQRQARQRQLGIWRAEKGIEY